VSGRDEDGKGDYFHYQREEKKQEYVEANTLLMNLIRDKLSFTGTKYVCGIGEYGACTVPILSC
jgi:aerobic-type carbon monoxide dehydrogenase small subunit (CoxS/CutS family)